MGKRFLYVGNWGFHPAPKGISRFEYDEESGELTLIDTVRSDIAAGQLALDDERGILYAVNECGERKGEYGGGGQLLAFKIDAETGELTQMCQRDSLCPEPSYLCLDGTGKYILACHCADPWHVTKIVRNADGTLSNQVLFDDGALVLFRLNADGSIGDAVDYCTAPCCSRLSETSQVNVDPVSGHIQLVEIVSRLHSVKMSPDGEMFICCDKGMDRIYCYKLDREAGKIRQTDTFEADWRSFPRYGAFHPVRKVFYANNEFCADVNYFGYDSAAGKIDRLGKVSAVFADPGLVEGKPVGAQDILVSPDGKTMYVTLCGINSISVFDLNEEGVPTLVQVQECGGNMPRGIALSPDGRFLLSGNMLSGNISVFAVDKGGRLKETGKIYRAVSPSAMKFYRAKLQGFRKEEDF